MAEQTQAQATRIAGFPAGLIYSDGQTTYPVQLGGNLSLAKQPDGSYLLSAAAMAAPGIRADDVQLSIDPGNSHVWTAQLKGQPIDLVVYDGGLKLSANDYSAVFDAGSGVLTVHTIPTEPTPGFPVTAHYLY